MYKYLILIVFYFFCLSGYSQKDPQTNAPNVIFPLMDQFIKVGFDINHRGHVKRLHNIEYIYVMDITRVWGADFFYNEYGTTDTYKVYRFYNTSLEEWRFAISINKVWISNPKILRRIFYKVMGHTLGLWECHDDCTHIMSKKNPSEFFFYDSAKENWDNEIKYFFSELRKAY